MALGRLIALLIGIGLLTGPIAGCNGSNLNLAAMLGVGGDSASTPAPASTPRPKPKRVLATPTPDPTPTPEPNVTEGPLRRNVQFDQIRSQGISQVYEGHTLAAVKTFHGALTKKPDDYSVKLWLGAIKKAVEKPRDAVPGGSREFQDVAARLHSGGQAPAHSNDTATTPTTSEGLPRPRDVKPPVSVDPALVF